MLVNRTIHPDGICEHSRALLDHHAVRWVGIEPAGPWVHADQPAAFVASVRRVLQGDTQASIAAQVL